MSDELRSAAERYRKWGVGEFDYVSEDSRPMGMLNDDRRTLAEAYLVEHPADDGEPVDLEWLRGLSRKGGDMSFMRVRLCDDGFHLMSPCAKPHEGIEGIEGIGDFVAPRVVTRGDVRRLCTALGIELKETGDGQA